MFELDNGHIEIENNHFDLPLVDKSRCDCKTLVESIWKLLIKILNCSFWDCNLIFSFSSAFIWSAARWRIHAWVNHKIERRKRKKYSMCQLHIKLIINLLKRLRSMCISLWNYVKEMSRLLTDNRFNNYFLITKKDTHSKRLTLLSFSPHECGIRIFKLWNPVLIDCIRRRSLELAISRRTRFSCSSCEFGDIFEPTRLEKRSTTI